MSRRQCWQSRFMKHDHTLADSCRHEPEKRIPALLEERDLAKQLNVRNIIFGWLERPHRRALSAWNLAGVPNAEYVHHLMLENCSLRHERKHFCPEHKLS